MGNLVRILGQGLIMKFAGGIWIERQIELIFPAEFKPRARKRIVAHLCRRVAFGEIGGVGGDFVSNDTDLHVICGPAGRDALSA